MMYFRTASLAPAFIAILVSLAACGDTSPGTGPGPGPDPQPEPVAGVVVARPGADLIHADESLQLSAQAKTAAGAVVAGASIAWSSSDAAVAQVSPTGLVTGTGWGEALITASAGAGQDTVRVRVIPADPQLPPAARVVDLAITFTSSCALTAAGGVYCWGENRFGEFGDGTASGQATPRRIAPPAPFTQISGMSGASRICGLTAAGAAFCAGSNLPVRRAFVRVGDGLAFRTLAGSVSTCGLTLEGAAYCLPGGTAVPVEVPGNFRFSAISGGYVFSCALGQAGAAFCWGNGGRLGRADLQSSEVPVAVGDGRAYVELGSGYEHTCALEAAGTAYCWGTEMSGQTATPRAVAATQPLRRLAAGMSHTCGLGADSTAICWMAPGAPAAVPGNLRFVDLEVGDLFACGRTAGGAVYCWGDNFKGQLGDGTNATRFRPVRVASFPP